MRYEELLHCIRAVADATNETELYVLGSQSILLQLDESIIPELALKSREADIATVKNMKTSSYIIDGNFCEDSLFERTFGIIVDGITTNEVQLPEGWEDRASVFTYTPINEQKITVYVPDIYDVAASKVCAHRAKDRVWIKCLYNAGILDMSVLLSYIGKLNIDYTYYERLCDSLQAIVDGVDVMWKP